MVPATPRQWAAGVGAITRSRRATKILQGSIDVARPLLAASPRDLRDTLPEAHSFSPASEAAYRRARDHLTANPDSPRWTTLLLFTLARVIGANATSTFNSSTWDELTIFWARLETAWLQGDGARIGVLLADADKKLFSGTVAQRLGADMPTRLAESSDMAPSWAFFYGPW